MWGTRGVGNKTGIHREQDGSDRSRHDNKQRQARERERGEEEREEERERQMNTTKETGPTYMPGGT